MTWQAWLVFAPACLLINLAPGPNNMLAMTNGLQVGLRGAVLAGAGRLAAFAVMILLAAVGLGAVLAASETAFQVVKWAGAAYLVYLGVQLWRRRDAVSTCARSAPAVRLGLLMRREFLVAIGNPKAILVFTAFFPQFLDPGQPAWGQFAVMGATFLAMEVLALTGYAFSGRQASQFGRSPRGRRLLNRISGSALIGAGLMLATSRRD